MAIDAVSRGAEIAAVLMRRARRLYAESPFELGLEADLFALSAVTPSAVTADRAEGTSAFLNTRKPAFHGN